MKWFVYILECNDGTFYIGLTNNIKRRLHAHNNRKSGARYTKTRRPVALKYFETVNSRGDAIKRELMLKKLKRAYKIALFKKKVVKEEKS